LKGEDVFPIGTSCIVAIKPNIIGPLFVSFNILNRPVELISLSISVSGATLDAATPAPSPR
jgi:hypothetical protein